MRERLQKVLARAGRGSRREMEALIEAGRVSVNGLTAQLGTCVDQGDTIQLDGEALKTRDLFRQSTRVLCYYKPPGVICSRRDVMGRPTVFDEIPQLKDGRWISIGRLDINSSGLLMFTNNGELAHRLLHPSNAIEREYAVRVLGEVHARHIERLQKGVLLDDGMARFSRVKTGGGRGANRWYYVTLAEGRKREIRRLWESQGFTVSRLIRVRFGPVALPKSRRFGEVWELDKRKVRVLRETVGLVGIEDNDEKAHSKRAHPSTKRRQGAK